MTLDEAINSIPAILEAVQRIEERAMYDQFMSPDDFEDEFGVSKSTQSSMRSNREIPYHKIKGKIRYKRSDVLEYVERFRIEKIEPKRGGHRTKRRTNYFS